MHTPILRTAAALCALAALAACTNPMAQPLVLDGPRTDAFILDEADCRALVEEQVTVDADGAVLGSAAGNAAVVALFKGDAEQIAGAAAIGMVAGAVAGEQELRNQQRAALIACMRGRGHNVIN